MLLNYRFVEKFDWADGIWVGEIGPYHIFDLHYNLPIGRYVELSTSILNLTNDVHRELIGGAKMGRQVVMRVTSEFY